MKEVEKELSKIQQEVCKVVQKMKTNFGIDPEAKLTSTDQHVSQDSCSIADQAAESSVINEVTQELSAGKNQL